LIGVPSFSSINLDAKAGKQYIDDDSDSLILPTLEMYLLETLSMLTGIHNPI
jgi:hypothetical protein